MTIALAINASSTRSTPNAKPSLFVMFSTNALSAPCCININATCAQRRVVSRCTDSPTQAGAERSLAHHASPILVKASITGRFSVSPLRPLCWARIQRISTYSMFRAMASMNGALIALAFPYVSRFDCSTSRLTPNSADCIERRSASAILSCPSSTVQRISCGLPEARTKESERRASLPPLPRVTLEWCRYKAVHQDGVSHHEAMKIISESQGKHFDRDVVEAFVNTNENAGLCTDDCCQLPAI